MPSNPFGPLDFPLGPAVDDDQPTLPGGVERDATERRIMRLAQQNSTDDRLYEIGVFEHGPTHLHGTAKRKIGDGWESLTRDDLRIGWQLVEVTPTGESRQWQIVDVDAGPPTTIDLMAVLR